MIVGIPKECKSDEYRIAMLPATVEQLCSQGHQVLVEKTAGIGSGYDDEQYTIAGAHLVDEPDEVFARSELIIKVKEPIKSEWHMMRQGQIIFTYFHFASSLELTEACLRSGITAVAYETLTDKQGRLPLLTPMSEVAGRMSIQQGAKYLEKPQKGRGILLGGVPGVEPADVLILGGGVVGTQAAWMAAGLGGRVTIMDVNLERLRYLADIIPPNVCTLYNDPHIIAEKAMQADLIIGAVLVPGGRTPVLIERSLLQNMKPGAVIVDVGVDQGGCVETTRPTTHKEPTYIVDGVVHYCVANMPGAVGRTSTQALCHATHSYVIRLANQGLDCLASQDSLFFNALNIHSGVLLNDAVAESHGLKAETATV